MRLDLASLEFHERLAIEPPVSDALILTMAAIFNNKYAYTASKNNLNHPTPGPRNTEQALTVCGYGKGRGAGLRFRGVGCCWQGVAFKVSGCTV